MKKLLKIIWSAIIFCLVALIWWRTEDINKMIKKEVEANYNT